MKYNTELSEFQKKNSFLFPIMLKTFNYVSEYIAPKYSTPQTRQITSHQEMQVGKFYISDVFTKLLTLNIKEV